MNETYVECLVACKKNALFSVLKYVLYGFAIACVLMAMLGAVGLFLLALLFAGIGYFVAPLADIEYEYLYLDKEITIDKVIAKQKRKRAISLDVNKAEVIAPTNSHELDSYRNRQHVDKDYSSGIDGAKTFTMVYSDKEQLMLIKFEPNSEMLSAIRTVFPRKVVEY